MVIYTDDCIMAAKNSPMLERAMAELAVKLKITDEGKVDKYLGEKVERYPDGSYKLSQPLLIDQILQTMGFNNMTKPKDIPALSSKILNRDVDGTTHETPWEYRRLLGQLNLLESTRPVIAYDVHQCARFAASPKSSHKHAILRIRRYLMKMRDRWMIMKPKGSSLELWCDVALCGTQIRHTSTDQLRNPELGIS